MLKQLPFDLLIVTLLLLLMTFVVVTVILLGLGTQGHPIHIRTMDWEMPELQALTIEVQNLNKKGIKKRRRLCQLLCDICCCCFVMYVLFGYRLTSSVVARLSVWRPPGRATSGFSPGSNRV